jgi:hypothetical protein
MKSHGTFLAQKLNFDHFLKNKKNTSGRTRIFVFGSFIAPLMPFNLSYKSSF